MSVEYQSRLVAVDVTFPGPQAQVISAAHGWEMLISVETKSLFLHLFSKMGAN